MSRAHLPTARRRGDEVEPLVTAEERAFYREQGFVRLDRPLVDADSLRVVRQTLDGLFSDANTPPDFVGELGTAHGNGTVPEVTWATLLRPELRQTKAFRVMRRVALELLQVPRVRPHFDHAIFKPPLTGGPTAWHQDVAFDVGHDVPVATVWLALATATIENGCMRFVPGSHIAPIYPHERFGRDGLQAVGADLSAAVACPLPAGGMTVHMQRTLHGTGPNRSDGIRAAWIVKFIPDDRRPVRRAGSAVRSRLRQLTGTSLPARVG
jgi:hypothetical protein